MLPSKHAFAFIIVTLVVNAMGIGLILPVMPDLLTGIQGGTLGNAAMWGGILTAIFAVMQFLFGPVVGALSDRFGRRPVLLASLIVMSLDYLVMAVAGSIWLLFIGRLVGGITAATQSTAAAYIADITPGEDKAARFGAMGAAFGVGFVLGPVIGGLLAEYGTKAPFIAAAILAGANAIFGFFVLPETVTDKTRRALDWRRANPFGAFRQIGKLPAIKRLLLLFFLYEFAFIVYPSVWAYYTKAKFGWSPSMVGYSLALFGISIAIVQGVLIKHVLARLGERGTIIYGIVVNGLVFVFLSLVWNGWVALAFTPVTALGAVVTPVLQSRMSRIAADNQQGELQGVISSVRSLATIFSPLLMTQVFWLATPAEGPTLPGAPFLLSAALMVVCLVVFLRGESSRVST
ncbi:MAG: DHA1 family tetracycline resistance protein-like MFS transporter [Granulosicoccus sp.]|jgi:DHA1 family tetracycline resistance protein-like MFS transporter